MKLCECGCGETTTVAKKTRRMHGVVRGQPMKFLSGHNLRISNPNCNGGRANVGGYILVTAKTHPGVTSKGYVREHILIAEKALGRYLPTGAEVHHVNEVKSDNRPENLVICENAAYHRLLHARMRAFRATGNPDAKPCVFCREYSVGLARRSDGRHYHRVCRDRYKQEWKTRKREQTADAKQLEGERL